MTFEYNNTPKTGRTVSLSGDGDRYAVGDPKFGNIHGTTRLAVTPEISVYRTSDNTQIGSTIKAGDINTSYILGNICLDDSGYKLAVAYYIETSSNVYTAYVYVYTLNGNTWSYEQVGHPDGVSGLEFWNFFNGCKDAMTMSRDGSTIVLAGFTQSSVSWKLNNGSWSQAITINDPNDNNGSWGYSVDLSDNGNILILGCGWADTNNMTNNGIAKVFTYANETWTLLAIKEGLSSSDYFAHVAIAGSSSIVGGNIRVAVGAINGDDGGTNSGEVTVYTVTDADGFQHIGSEPTLTGEVAGDCLGFEVKLSQDGSRLVAGSIYHGPTTPTDLSKAGRIYVYDVDYDSNTVIKTQEISEPTPVKDRKFGYEMSLSSDGTKLIAGGLNNLSDNVHLFEVSNASGSGDPYITAFFF